MENNRLLVLVSKGAGNRKQISDQSRALHLLDCKKIPYELIDGIKMKERRNELFDISGVRGQYPQFFLVCDGDEKPIFVGDWETVEMINDNSGLPDTILEANPSIMTWDTVMSGSRNTGAVAS